MENVKKYEAFVMSSGGDYWPEMQESKSGEYVSLADYEALRVENSRLQSVLSDWDRILRASVPEAYKDCTSPVGAVQNHLGDLDQEIERLRAEIDAANAQEPYAWASLNREDFTYHESKTKSFVGHGWVALYERPIPAQQSPAADSELNFYGNVNVSEAISMAEQQSPAVAVPDDELIDKIKNIWWKAKSSHIMRTDTAKEIIQAVLDSSPRITEQEVVEAVTSFHRYFSLIEDPSSIKEFASAYASALLEELNKPESVGGQ